MNTNSTISRKSREMSVSELEAFGTELDELRKSTMASLGKKDADYIYGVRDFVRYSEIAGRASLMLGWLPPFWLAGSAMLGVSKIVENMELGHNVMHGQYDWMNDDTMRGSTYEWDTACTAENWRYTHNYIHHTYTNIHEMDHDMGYGAMRLFPEQEWSPRFLLNPLYAVGLVTSFQWTLALQSLEFEKLLTKEKTVREIAKEMKPVASKMRKKFVKDYVFFPALAGPAALPVITGNATANLMRNVWASTVIFCGHFTEDVETFSKDILINETRGQWYLRQLHGSSNLKGGKTLNFMTGNLSHQIEHHMFPDVPGVRYEEMSIKVKEICKRYGQHYNTGSFGKQLGTVVGRLFKYSLPYGQKAKLPIPKNIKSFPMIKKLSESFEAEIAA